MPNRSPGTAGTWVVAAHDMRFVAGTASLVWLNRHPLGAGSLDSTTPSSVDVVLHLW